MKHILNIGSLNLDFVYRVPHFVQPGESLAVSVLHRGPGGKGLNQSIAAARAGATVRHAGKIGRDGDLLRNVLLADGIDVSHLHETDQPTGHAIIQVNDAGENAILIFPGANRTLTESDIFGAFDGFGPGDILLVQNEVNHVDQILTVGRDRGLRVIFNPSPVDPASASLPLDTVSVLVCNEIEGSTLSGGNHPETILEILAQRLPETDIILTLGSRGCRGIGPGGKWELDAKPVDVVDTTAAGDTFVGYLAAGLAAGWPITDAAKRANAAAALTVGRPGAADSIPQAAELDA